MLNHQIFIGFSDIKTELRTRARIFKDMQKLKLWFSLTQGVLYAHDYHDHEKCIIIAIHTAQEGWSIRLDPKSFGHMLIQDVAGRWPESKIADELNNRFIIHGHHN